MRVTQVNQVTSQSAFGLRSNRFLRYRAADECEFVACSKRHSAKRVLVTDQTSLIEAAGAPLRLKSELIEPMRVHDVPARLTLCGPVPHRGLHKGTIYRGNSP